MNRERNKKIQSLIDDMVSRCEDIGTGMQSDDMMYVMAVLLRDISVSLANIADSMEMRK